MLFCSFRLCLCSMLMPFYRHFIVVVAVVVCFICLVVWAARNEAFTCLPNHSQTYETFSRHFKMVLSLVLFHLYSQTAFTFIIIFHKIFFPSYLFCVVFPFVYCLSHMVLIIKLYNLWIFFGCQHKISMYHLINAFLCVLRFITYMLFA